MNKNNLEKFIEKYNLSGNIEAIKWIVSNKELSTICASDDKNVIVNISTNSIEIEDGEYNIFQTTLFRKMLNVLDNDITIKTKKEKTNTVLFLEDKKNKLRFALADPSVIPVAPKAKILPSPDLSIDISTEVMTAFNKAVSALSEEQSFEILVDEHLIPQIIFGKNKRVSNTNQIIINIDDKKHIKQVKSMRFSAEYLKNIFSVNKDFETGKLELSENGLLTLSFYNTNFTSIYYLFEIIN